MLKKIWTKLSFPFIYAFYYLKMRIAAIHFTKYHFKYWWSSMVLQFAYLIKGVIGIMTLNLINPEITHRPSKWMALKKSDAHTWMSLKRQKARLEKIKEETANNEKTEHVKKIESEIKEIEKKQEVFDDIDSEIEEWAKQFSKKKKYDEQGNLIKE